MYIYEKTENATPIRLITESQLNELMESLPDFIANWLDTNRFTASPGEVCIIPGENGFPEVIFAGFDRGDSSLWALATLPRQLPLGEYYLQSDFPDEDVRRAAIGWGLGCYHFDQFRTVESHETPQLYLEVSPARVRAIVESIALVRNLINTPANHMMPEDLETVMRHLAERHEADIDVISGQGLLNENFPAIHAVGRASAHEPRLIELNWGDEEDPLITLVGKGVCFDTGGLDIKSSGGMRLMKKDMGGAAHVIGLANLIMELELPVSLQVLVPAVDNAIGGDAFRPGDILATRSGKTVEVENTDAEGRLILCDALSYAAEFDPDMVIDFATLTGAARVALGTEIPVFFCNDRHLMQKVQIAATTSNELVWNLPLHLPYRDKLKSHFADLMNCGDSYGGAITAALFLNEFVPSHTPWAHFDVMAWNLRDRPGRPVGGEAMGLLTVFELLEQQFAAED